MSQKMMRRLEQLPRVELHLHLEGSVTLPRLRRLWPGARREPGLPGDPAEAYQHRSFADFLRHFAMVTRALRKPSHLAQVTADLSRFLGRQRIVAAEVFLSPVIFTRRGIPFLEILDAVEEAARDGARRGGPSIRWILDGVRQWGVRALEETLECARSSRGRVLGIGLGGDEASVPAREFAALFAEARRSGLRTVAHAGEFAGPRSLRDAVEWLGAERIGHGIRALEDPSVARLLKREGVPLDVCPSSNLGTRVVARWRDHPLPRLVRSGMRVSLNSDDPALFRTSLAEEYRRAHRRLGFSPSALYRIHRQSVRASFLPEREKSRLLAASRRIWEGGTAGTKVRSRGGGPGKKVIGRRSASGRA
jgi:aminodeoxyfutalosine deaminase